MAAGELVKASATSPRRASAATGRPIAPEWWLLVMPRKATPCARARRRFLHRQRERGIGEAVPRIHQHRAAAFGTMRGLRGAIGAAVAQEGGVLRHARQAMARLALGLGGDEGARRQRGHVGIGARRGERARGAGLGLGQVSRGIREGKRISPRAAPLRRRIRPDLPRAPARPAVGLGVHELRERALSQPSTWKPPSRARRPVSASRIGRQHVALQPRDHRRGHGGLVSTAVQFVISSVRHGRLRAPSARRAPADGARRW
jgi:hypothetical protein